MFLIYQQLPKDICRHKVAPNFGNSSLSLEKGNCKGSQNNTLICLFFCIHHKHILWNVQHKRIWAFWTKNRQSIWKTVPWFYETYSL